MESALERRERLKALRAAAQAAEAQHQPAAPAAPEAGTQQQDAAPESEQPVLKFRSYVLKDQKIAHEKVAPAQPPKIEAPVVEVRPEEAKQEDILANIAPKKANWDLKREVAPKLDKLERRTQRALVEIMQEEERKRIEAEGIED